MMTFRVTLFWLCQQIDTSEAEMPDDKDDSFQASMIALHGSTCSADLDYLQVSTPKAGQQFQQLHIQDAYDFQRCSPSRLSMCWLLQLAARLDLVHNHPRFAPGSDLAAATQTSPEQTTPFTPPIQGFSTTLDPHDHFLSQRPPKDEDFSFAGRVDVLEEAVESLHIQQEVAATLLRDAWPPLEPCRWECGQIYTLCFDTRSF